MALVLSGSIDISGSMTATTIIVSAPGAAGMVSSSQQITNYYKFAETASANTFYGTQTFVNTETTFNYNPQTSLLASYNYLNFGGGTIMYRDAPDIYISSNAKYGPAGTMVANYTSAQGMGMLTMDGGALGYQSSTGSVSAGVAYPVPSRWNITPKGMMGLGYTSPQDFTNASGYGQFVIGPTDGNGNVTGMTIYSTLTNGIMFADATSGPGAYAGYLLYTHASDKLEIATSSTPRLTLDSNGSTFSTSNVTITNGNLVMGTSGKGIDFSATTNSSGTMTSELLNDYEEGTFTPTYTGVNLTINNYGNRAGFYTKVGRLVTVTINIMTESVSVIGSEAVKIGGLPFTSNSTAESSNSANIFNSARWTALPPICGQVGPNSTEIELHSDRGATGAGTDPTTVKTGDMATGAGNRNMVRLTATYFTA